MDWVEKMAKSGLNTLGLHSGGGAAHNVYTELKFMGEQSFRDKLTANGLDYEYEVHASDVLIDHKLFDEHPEYFPQNTRRRTPIGDANWCTSNPTALNMVVENALEMVRRLPSSTHRYFFWGVDRLQNDWCHCEKCSHLNGADQALITANAIAERIAEVEHLGWFVGTGPEVEVLNETSLIDTDAQIYRPDRVIRSADKVVIVDYKFGEYNDRYERQLRKYAGIWRRMGYADIKSYVWYVQRGDIVEVSLP